MSCIRFLAKFVNLFPILNTRFCYWKFLMIMIEKILEAIRIIFLLVCSAYIHILLWFMAIVEYDSSESICITCWYCEIAKNSNWSQMIYSYSIRCGRRSCCGCTFLFNLFFFATFELNDDKKGQNADCFELAIHSGIHSAGQSNFKFPTFQIQWPSVMQISRATSGDWGS